MSNEQLAMNNGRIKETFPRDYGDWLMVAATAGFDWENNPPPREMITEELCIAVLEDAPEHLGNIPMEFRTAEVCFKAVYIDDDALQFVPENLREEVKARKDAITEDEWIDELYWYNGNHYLKLPKKLLTSEFCRAMVECNGYTIDLVLEELKTSELLEIAGNEEDRDLKHREFLVNKMVENLQKGYRIFTRHLEEKRKS
jgi:hypothetical protein